MTKAWVRRGLWKIGADFEPDEIAGNLSEFGCIWAAKTVGRTWKIYFASDIPRDSEIANSLDCHVESIIRPEGRAVFDIADDLVKEYDLEVYVPKSGGGSE